MNAKTVEQDKGIVYCNRVLIGNWYEASTLEEYKLNEFLVQMKKGDLMLARFRKMTENLNKPTILTSSTGFIAFGAKISLYAPHVPFKELAAPRGFLFGTLVFHARVKAEEPAWATACQGCGLFERDAAARNIKGNRRNMAVESTVEGKEGLLLGGRISTDDIAYSQDLEDGCAVVGLPYTRPTQRNAFILTSADYCDRTGELVKYNQEFLLKLASSVDKQPLYLRYDPDAVPGLCGPFSLYLSKNFVSNTRWRVLPVQKPDITRFEQEGTPIIVNQDVVINHCATNLNLGINLGFWVAGFHGKICAPLLKTCLDVYGRELPSNIWQIHTPLNTQS